MGKQIQVRKTGKGGPVPTADAPTIDAKLAALWRLG
jgi:hypothetical protein